MLCTHLDIILEGVGALVSVTIVRSPGITRGEKFPGVIAGRDEIGTWCVGCVLAATMGTGLDATEV